MFLHVSPMKGVHRFGIRGKLSPRYVLKLSWKLCMGRSQHKSNNSYYSYIGPYKVLEGIGPVVKHPSPLRPGSYPMPLLAIYKHIHSLKRHHGKVGHSRLSNQTRISPR